MEPEVSVSGVSARCLIVSANRVVTPYPVYPLGAACLVSSLRKKGCEVEHFDLLADGGFERLQEILAKKNFDIVGVSIRNLDTVDSSAPDDFLPDIKLTVDFIRERVSCPVVLGGPAFSIMPEDLMEYMQADYGIAGEGEELLPWLVRQIAEGRPPVEKLFYSRPLEDVWKPADLSASTARYYLDRGGMLNIQTKRGCPHKCGYCSYPNIEGKNVRYRDPEEVAREVFHLRDSYGARYIFFADSYFNDGEGRYLEIAEALIRKNNTLPWCAFFRPDPSLGKAELRLLKRSGLAAIELGTDAACDATLSGLGKSFSFADVMKVNENIVGENIPCAHYVIFGGPGEDTGTLREGLENLDRLDRCVVFAFVGIRILPDTAIYRIAVAEGMLSQEQSLLRPVFYFSPKISRSELEESVSLSFHGRNDRIYPCHEFEGRVAALHELGHAGPLWDLILHKRIKKWEI